MSRADISIDFTDMTTAVLRELRGERRGAGTGPDSADHFVASADGDSSFSHHLRRLQDASPATGSHAEPSGRDYGPDIYSSRPAPGIVRSTFEVPAREAGATAESARGLQEEPKSR